MHVGLFVYLFKVSSNKHSCFTNVETHLPREKPLVCEGEENPAWRVTGSQVSSRQFRQVLNPPLGRYIISSSKGSPI